MHKRGGGVRFTDFSSRNGKQFLYLTPFVNSLGLPAVSLAGFPAVFFIRRSSGGLEGLPAVCRAGLTPNSENFNNSS